jgi:predicted HAD superfamily Cof-like phosphohydrolase
MELDRRGRYDRRVWWRRGKPDYLGAVRTFHQAFEVPVGPGPNAKVASDLRASRTALMREELDELIEAMRDEDIVSVADGLADLLYVVFGTAAAYGVPIDDVFLEVHRSNMSKLGSDGRPVVGANGKRLKGPRYRPPDLAPILDVE